MLLYNTRDNSYLNLSLDIFERSKISAIFKETLNKINLGSISHFQARKFIELESYTQSHMMKDKKLQLRLYIYRSNLLQPLTTGHINPYKCQNITFGYNNLSISKIPYKYMNLPLGKLRIRYFKSNSIKRWR